MSSVYSTSETITLERHTCGTCGIIFAVPFDWINERRKTAGSIHCPNGCKRSWVESEADKVRKELREAKCEILRKEQKILDEREAKDEAERKLRMVSRGVCPCCKRTFSNLARHMKTKHADKAKTP